MAHKTIGNEPVSLLECVNPIKQKWKARWNVVQIEENTYEWVEEDFDHEPTEDELVTALNDWVNNYVKDKIVSGFSWNGMQVWLSLENQVNYKSIYDLAVQGNENVLPVTFKFGTDDSPILYTFSSMEELADFYTKAMRHIQDALNEGWASKQNYFVKQC